MNDHENLKHMGGDAEMSATGDMRTNREGVEFDAPRTGDADAPSASPEKENRRIDQVKLFE
jgi:hypothetical protein